LSLLYIILFSKKLFEERLFLKIILSIIILYLSYHTGARATLLSFLVIILFYIFKKKYIHEIAFCSILILPILILNFIGEVYNYYPFIEPRFELWNIQANELLSSTQNILFGIDENYWSTIIYVSGNKVNMNTHNLYFDIIVRNGILFYSVFSFILIILFKKITDPSVRLSIIGLSVYIFFNGAFTHAFTPFNFTLAYLFGSHLKS
jgi:hypothetical protein